jgi:hypothetical protein
LAFGVWHLAFGIWRLAFGVWRRRENEFKNLALNFKIEIMKLQKEFLPLFHHDSFPFIPFVSSDLCFKR